MYMYVHVVQVMPETVVRVYFLSNYVLLGVVINLLLDRVLVVRFELHVHRIYMYMHVYCKRNAFFLLHVLTGPATVTTLVTGFKHSYM